MRRCVKLDYLAPAALHAASPVQRLHLQLRASLRMPRYPLAFLSWPALLACLPRQCCLLAFLPVAACLLPSSLTAQAPAFPCSLAR